MARKKAKKKAAEERGFTGMLAGTVVLGIVFSAGLITGQRLLRAEARAPMVSLSTTTQAPSPVDDDDAGKPSLRTTFSFYDHLTSDAQAAPAPTEEAPVKVEAPVVAAKPTPDAAKPPVAANAAAEDKPAEPADSAPPVAANDKPNDKPIEKPVEKPVEKPDDAVATILDDVVDSLAGSDGEKKPAAALPARYTLQVSSHPDRNSAEQEMGRLRGVGVEPHIVVVDVPGKGKLWRVRVGKFHSMDEARDFQGSMKARRGVPGFVTPL